MNIKLQIIPSLRIRLFVWSILPVTPPYFLSVIRTGSSSSLERTSFSTSRPTLPSHLRPPQGRTFSGIPFRVPFFPVSVNSSEQTDVLPLTTFTVFFLSFTVFFLSSRHVCVRSCSSVTPQNSVLCRTDLNKKCFRLYVPTSHPPPLDTRLSGKSSKDVVRRVSGYHDFDVVDATPTSILLTELAHSSKVKSFETRS